MSVFSRIISARLMVLLAMTASAVPGIANEKTSGVLRGTIESGGHGLQGYTVYVYAAFVDQGPSWRLLGSGASNDAGTFRIQYSAPKGLARNATTVLFVEAERGNAMLASAIAADWDLPASVVVNERTTVATGNAFAQFVSGRSIRGNRYGMSNAVHMAANLASPETGLVGTVLNSSPNGTETSTLATFNSLSNAVASCVAEDESCTKLFAAATPPGGRTPTNVMEAVASIVKNPAYPGYGTETADPLFELAQSAPIYQPALSQRPTNWLLFLKITGGFYSEQSSTNLMNGPGNFAIDEKGFVWLNDNYRPEPPNHFACAGRRLMKFYPWGEPVPGTPYFGGGLSGAGFGITLDPSGHVWVGNFGFQDLPCELLPIAAQHNSVSEFESDGTPLSPSKGFTEGKISYPQGTVSDRDGNIWIGNCGSDSVTIYRGGNHLNATNIALGSGSQRMKPFGVAIDPLGNAWLADNASNTVSVVSPAGNVIGTLPGTRDGKAVLTHPMGIAADVQGNMWVANSDYVDLPCPTPKSVGSAKNPSITMFQGRTREPYPGSPFTGGGLTLPWGISVDGDDTVWVFNFGAVPVGTATTMPTGISRFCGADTKKCPAGMKTGQAISPATGYTSDSMERITGGQIDPSGNLWLADNWKIDANPLRNPGGNALVIAIGAAGPLATPLIGPPVPLR